MGGRQYRFIGAYCSCLYGTGSTDARVYPDPAGRTRYIAAAGTYRFALADMAGLATGLDQLRVSDPSGKPVRSSLKILRYPSP